MSSDKKPNSNINGARRNFLGLAAATGAKAAALGSIAASTILPASVAKAMGRKWWKKDDDGGSPMCFLRGTAIKTPTGEVCIEDLKIGDLVQTVRGASMPVKWVGRHTYRRSGASWSSSVLPVRVARHAIDEATPYRDLYLSPGHALLIDGVLIRAQDLVNGASITPALPAGCETIEYFHIVLDSHEAILAEGAAAETFFLDAGNHEGFTNFVEFARLYPEMAHIAMVPMAPIVGYGGRAHLKSLLRLVIGRFAPAPEPAEDAYGKIAARAGHLAH